MEEQVENTENTFEKWFAGSVTKSSDGKPGVFYHLSRSKDRFEEFLDTMNKNQYNNCKGFYFVSIHNKGGVAHLADGVEYIVYLSIKKPLYIYPKGFHCECSRGHKYAPLDIHERFIQEAKEEGYDGIIICNSTTMHGIDEYVVFESNQIKGVNNETFSITDNNIFK